MMLFNTHPTAKEEGEEEEAGEEGGDGVVEEDTKTHLRHVVPLCLRW